MATQLLISRSGPLLSKGRTSFFCFFYIQISSVCLSRVTAMSKGSFFFLGCLSSWVAWISWFVCCLTGFPCTCLAQDSFFLSLLRFHVQLHHWICWEWAIVFWVKLTMWVWDYSIWVWLNESVGLVWFISHRHPSRMMKLRKKELRKLQQKKLRLGCIFFEWMIMTVVDNDCDYTLWCCCANW